MTVKKFAIVAIAAIVGIFFAVIVLAPVTRERPVAGPSSPPQSACGDICALIIEPDDGIAPVRTMIQLAKESIELVMYELEDKQIESDLVAAQRRGVSVRVLLSPGYEGEPSAINEAAYDTLRAHGVAVRWAPDYFALTHEKSLVVDDAQALVMSFNLVPKYYPTSRDFGIVDRDRTDIIAMEGAFESDWQGNATAANAGHDLVWSPGSRAVITALIDSAQASLDIYNEEMADEDITAALIRAALRGVAVRIDMTYSPDWKNVFKKLTAAHVDIRTYNASAARYIHAKMIITDEARAFVGSENFSATSLDKNRELGIVLSNKNIIHSLQVTFDADWFGGSQK